MHPWRISAIVLSLRPQHRRKQYNRRSSRSEAVVRLGGHVTLSARWRSKKMKTFSIALVFLSTVAFARASEPDGLTLPPGFHASVVAEGLGPVRHLAVRGNGDIYVSTPVDRQNRGSGVIALHLDASHKATQVEHFSAVDGGTGIRFYKGALYAASASAIYRFTFSGGSELLPGKD